jgi:hypothetical protein
LAVLSRLGQAEAARIIEALRIRPTLSLDEIKRFFGCRIAGRATALWD